MMDIATISRYGHAQLGYRAASIMLLPPIQEIVMHVDQSAPPPPFPAAVELLSTIDRLPASAAMVDEQLDVVWWNQAFRAQLGITGRDPTPFPFNAIIDPEASGWLHEFRTQRRGSTPAPVHAPMRTLDGTRFDALLRSVPLATAHHSDLTLITISPIVGVRYDHHPFRRALEVQQELVCEWAPHGTVLYANRSYREFFGLGPHIVGQSLDRLLEQRGDPPLEGMGTSIRMNIRRGVEQSPDGYRETRTYPTGRTVEWTNSAVRDADGSLTSILSVGRDVTARTANEAQMRRNEERFRMMATQIWDTIVLVDPLGRLIDSTAPYRSDLGHGPDFWADVNLVDLMHPDDRGAASAALEHLVSLGPGGQHSLEARAVRADGNITWLELNGTNLLDHPSVEAILLSVRNIDERKQFEQERAAMLGRERVTLERRERFVTHVSHELRNLVHGTLGLSEILSRAAVPLEINELVTALHRQSTSLRRVVDDLLDAAELELHPDQVRNDVIDLTEVFPDITLAFTHEPIPVTFDPPDDHDRFVIGDTDRLRQALTNLVRNAVRHTTDGEVRLSADRGEAVGTIRISVTDTGSGIDPDDIDRLFLEYARGRGERTRGLGLGLSVARNIAEQMGGRIGATPRNDGATFWIELRESATSDATPSRGIARPHAGTPLVANLRVLVLDDDPVNRLVASMQLHELGSQVVTAATPSEAFDLMAQRPFDAVLCDLNLGDESGLDFVRRTRATERPQPFIAVMTGDADPKHHLKALQAGADHFMVKPATIADVADTLSRCTRTIA